MAPREESGGGGEHGRRGRAGVESGRGGRSGGQVGRVGSGAAPQKRANAFTGDGQSSGGGVQVERQGGAWGGAGGVRAQRQRGGGQRRECGPHGGLCDAWSICS